jgi:hypothetical protein
MSLAFYWRVQYMPSNKTLAVVIVSTFGALSSCSSALIRIPSVTSISVPPNRDKGAYVAIVNNTNNEFKNLSFECVFQTKNNLYLAKHITISHLQAQGRVEIRSIAEGEPRDIKSGCRPAAAMCNTNIDISYSSTIPIPSKLCAH